MNRRDLLLASLGAAAVPGPLASAEWRMQPPWRSWRVDGDRVARWLVELSRFGTTPDGGVSRTGFSDADVEARAWIQPIMREAGLEVAIDPAGNILGKRPGSDPTLKPLLFGSHIDSVLNGGNYDGDVGTLGAIEVARLLAEKGYRNRHPLWVTLWCDEERGLTGSRGFLGQVAADELARPAGAAGPSLADQIRKIGGDPAAMAGYRHEPGSIAGYLELHIEQGGVLDQTGVAVGVVEGIVGIRSWEVTVTGFANHAGTTPMDQRKNALLAASEVILAVDRLVKAMPGRQVGTVGRLQVRPGAQNVIPGEVEFSIEIRDLSTDTLDRLWAEIRGAVEPIMARQGTSWAARERASNLPAIAAEPVRGVIDRAARGLGLSTRSMPSGAGHDAQNLARIGPMGMIFIPSVGGISHSPREYTRPEDVTNGVNVLLQTVLQLDQAAEGAVR